MGPGTRVSRGFTLVVEGLRLADRHRGLLVFPMLAALAVVTVVLLVGGTLVDLALRGTDPLLVGALAVGAVAVTGVVVTDCNVAQVVAATAVFEGRRADLRDALATTAANWRVVVTWGLVTTLVGVPFRAMEALGTAAGQDPTRQWLGSSWSALSFFVVPELLDGADGLSEGFDRSQRRFRRLWGQAAGVSLGVDGLAVAGLALVALALALGVGYTATPIGTVVALVGAFALAVIVLARQATVAITKAALYRYARSGDLPLGYEVARPESLAYGLRSR